MNKLYKLYRKTHKEILSKDKGIDGYEFEQKLKEVSIIKILIDFYYADKLLSANSFMHCQHKYFVNFDEWLISLTTHKILSLSLDNLSKHELVEILDMLNE